MKNKTPHCAARQRAARFLRGSAVPILLLMLCGESFGQALPRLTPPDAGQLNQDLRAAPPRVTPQEKPSPLPTYTAPQDYTDTLAPGERVKVRGVRMVGNKAFSYAQLYTILPKLHPEGETIADLNAIRDAVTELYRARGYPLARAMFLAQQSNDGYLTLTIVEGRIGRINIVDKSRLDRSTAQKIIQSNLCPGLADCPPGALITDRGLQRSTLLLSDVPGLVVQSGLSRGNDFGTADLTVSVSDASGPGNGLFVVTGGVDNFGASSTGVVRGSTGFLLNNPLGIGDRLSVSLIGSGESLWDVGVDYNALVGSRGMRVGVSGSRTRYFLGGDFEVLDATGIVDMGSAYVTIPIIRSLKFSLNSALSFTHKELHDNIGLIASYSRNALDNLSVNLSGDWSDTFLGGGFNQYSAGYTHGFLHINDPVSKVLDEDLNTRGNFDKLSISYTRQQMLWGGFTALASARGQYGFKNLSSAEKFFLGGPSGVRAYSVGEAGGDSGGLASMELRYTYPIDLLGDSRLTLGGFYDAGWVRKNANPIAGAVENESSMGGPGVHLSLSRPGVYNVDVSWASQVGSRISSVEPDKRDQLWLQLAFDF